MRNTLLEVCTVFVIIIIIIPGVGCHGTTIFGHVGGNKRTNPGHSTNKCEGGLEKQLRFVAVVWRIITRTYRLDCHRSELRFSGTRSLSQNLHTNSLIGSSLSEPHHRRSLTVKSVFLLARLLAGLLASSLIWMIAVYISTNLNTLMVH